MARGPKKPAPVASAPVPEALTSATGIMTIPGVNLKRLTTLVIGDSPLVTHHFDEKMRKKMEDKQTGKAEGGRQAKDPVANFEGARYRLSNGTDGIPAGGIKACIIGGARHEATATMAGTKGSIRIIADDPATNLVRIMGPEVRARAGRVPSDSDAWPRMRTDVTRNATGVADIRHRPEYWPWALLLNIDYLPEAISAERLLQMLAYAGFTEGLCEWRPGSPKSKSGQWGTFRLATAEEVAAFENGRLFKTNLRLAA